MTPTIVNGKDIPLNKQQGTIPDLSTALNSYFQALRFIKVTKAIVSFEAVESGEVIEFKGLWMPMRNRELYLKPEGQRAWNWFVCYTQQPIPLEVDDAIQYFETQYRVMAKKDWSLYGYRRYELIEDWDKAGPVTEVTDNPGNLVVDNHGQILLEP